MIAPLANYIDLLGLHPSLQGVIAQVLMAALVVAGRTVYSAA